MLGIYPSVLQVLFHLILIIILWGRDWHCNAQVKTVSYHRLNNFPKVSELIKDRDRIQTQGIRLQILYFFPLISKI